jgi:flagellar hook assembly protein FlgD
VRLGVFDAAGRLVRVLVDDRLARGAHTVVWNGRDKNAATVSPGVYFLRLESSRQVRLAKAVVLK